MSALTVLEARALHARLSNPASDDPLAKAFKRLTADRRARLINFLADARRREARRR
jgi:O-methyltransferase involved in polyketide biosynthesis